MRLLTSISLASLLLALCVPSRAQVPIDLSQAKEFKVVWSKVFGGYAAEPHYIPAPCGAAFMDILSVGSSTGGFGCFTQPRIDTTRVVEGWGSVYHLFDYDGVPPLEYMNDNGRVDRCLGSGYPFQKQRGIDTIWCWPGTLNVFMTEDVDGDGYSDLVCDKGGDLQTARVIRGGPNAGQKCERILHIPKASHRSKSNSTTAFWKSASGVWRLLQTEQDSGALYAWHMLYEVRITQEQGTTRVSFVKTDSLRGRVNGIGDAMLGDAAVLTDTVLRKDWLLTSHELNDAERTWVLERFDATEGRFTSTGEQITGVSFNQPWVAGYSLGTDRPVVAFHANNVGRVFSFANDLGRPFAKWFPQGALQPPVSGMVMINDQTGDSQPDLIAAGGSTKGAVALYTLDPNVTSVNAGAHSQVPASARMAGMTLEVTLSAPSMISAQLVTVDGRMFPALHPVQGSTGINRYDLGSTLGQQPAGAYILRVRVGESFLTINLVR